MIDHRDQLKIIGLLPCEMSAIQAVEGDKDKVLYDNH